MRHRVFIGLTEIAGYFGSLRQGLEEAGIPATFVDESGDPYSYRGSGGPFWRLYRLIARVRAERRASYAGSLRRFLLLVAAAGLRPPRVASRIVLLGWAAARHDVFVFGGDQSFLPGHLDLLLLRLLRKRVVWIFTGSDHRPPYLNGRMLREAVASGDFHRLARRVAAIHRRVATIERRAVPIAHRASAQFHSRPFVDVQAIGLPIQRRLPPPVPRSGLAVRILHAPSDPVSKGSDSIRRAIDNIRGRGYAIEYDEVSGRPNAEVIAAIATSDLIVDEVFSDSPVGILAVEAAHLGKPTVVGGYYAAEPAGFAADRLPPTRFVLPDCLEAAIEELVSDRVLREDLGRRAQTFVDSRWSQVAIARRLMQVITGSAPDDWWVEPARLTYVHGWGTNEDDLRSALARFVQSQGEPALQLGHNPRLAARIRTLINDGPQRATEAGNGEDRTEHS
jgi:hypothetical protein